MTPRPLRIGIDTGGTFTDIAVLERGRIRVHKLPSTPDDPSRAVLEGLAAVRGTAEVDVVHGTTVGLNAILTGRLARTALVTSRGFRDLVEIGRQDRPHLYEIEPEKPAFPVPRRLRFEVGSRRRVDGTRLAKPTRAELAQLRAELARARVESIAIGLLHAYEWPQDEHEIAAALADLGVPITCSADLAPIPGEYERFASAVANAALAPIVGSYVAELQRGIEPGRVRLMRSSGGIMPADEAREFPARALLSGPAGGVAACAALAKRLAEPRVATFDMGGTSTDVAMVESDRWATAGSGSTEIAGLPLSMPAVDVHTIGCGGGSIAYADAGGALRVGPESAGAVPGPACYGVGDQPTVTDAHVVLGHLGASTLLGGAFAIEPPRARSAVERLAERLGLGVTACARGILEVAETAMMRALLVITVERRIDPESLPLIAFGGAGGLHAAGLVRRLGMRYAALPDNPGAFSAVGLALAGNSSEATTTVLRPLNDLTASDLRRRLVEVEQRALAGLTSPGARVQKLAVLRFAGQGAGLSIDASGSGLGERFRRAHEQQFGFVPTDRPIELVELMARATTAGPRLAAERAAAPRSRPRPRPVGTRRGLSGGPAIPVYLRDRLAIGSRLVGPALIDDLTGVTVVPADFKLERRAAGLILSRANSTRPL